MQFSFWEYNHYNTAEACVIIGAGIVGLSTALEIKKNNPLQNVVVIEKYFPPQGASTKNAGFACFGSVTELMDDLVYMIEAEVVEIVGMRWKGIQLLKERLHLKNIAIEFNGGKELFLKNHFVNEKDIDKCNGIMEMATGVSKYFAIGSNTHFPSLDKQCVFMSNEGQLNAMNMMDAFHTLAVEAGVKFLYGHEVSDINFNQHSITIGGEINLEYEKLFICTNGFTTKLLPECEVIPARNHVMVTNEIKNLSWSGVYHFDKGYYYFRRVGNRILLGGARNLDIVGETSAEFIFNENIKSELKRFLNEVVAPGHNAFPEYWWTGILGIGPSKYPILKQINADVYIGVRLGGMGVAIGSYMGKKLAEMAFAEM